MPLSTDVNLPKSHKARFPDKCVVCGARSPGSSVRLITGSIGWWTWLLWWFGKPFTVRAPACRRCGWRLHLMRLTRLMLTIAVCLALCWLVWPLLSEHVPRAGRKWAMMGLAMIALAPYILFWVFFPDPFDITAKSDSVDYEFRNEDLAYEFAELNEDAAWVNIR